MSNIKYLEIDETYPIAGQDNDSQGFRDNFNVIKDSLATAKSEIGDLEINTAKTNTYNDFTGNILENAALLASRDKAFGIDNVIATLDVNWANGNYQSIQAGGDINLRLTGWPESDPTNLQMGRMRIVLTGDTLPGADIPVTRTVSFSGTGGAILRLNSNFTNPVEITYNNVAKIFEFWTSDGGNVVYGDFIGEFS